MLKPILSQEEVTLWNSLINASRHIVLIGHSSPDGDAIGSSLALYHYLLSIEKAVAIVMPNCFPDFLAWLPQSKSIVNAQYHRDTASRILQEADLIVSLDFCSKGRVDDLEEHIADGHARHIVIDHHLNPEYHPHLLVSNPVACSTCEIVFSLLYQLGAYDSLSRDTATCIYCGMMTDTGGFTYNSTRPEIYLIISQLLAKGIDKDKIYRNVYHNYSIDRMRLMGYILNEKMVYDPEFHASYFTLTREEMKRYNFKKGDAEGIVNLPLGIKGTKLSISLREDTEKPLIRVSLRSVDDFPCNKMAEEFFNGGGHLNASGGSLPCSITEAEEITRKAFQKYHKLLKDNNC